MLQNLFQGIPHERIEQHIFCLKHQITAVGLMDGACFHHREVRSRVHELVFVFYFPEDIVIVRKRFDDRWGAFAVFIVHKEIDFVFYERVTVAFRQLERILRLRCIGQPEDDVVFGDVRQNFIEIIQDFF